MAEPLAPEAAAEPLAPEIAADPGLPAAAAVKRRWPRRFAIALVSFALLVGAGTGGLNLYVVTSAKSRIKPAAEVGSGYDCVLVLGAGVVGQTPSPMLAQRLDTGIELYQQGVAPVILVSGDNSTVNYNEVEVMRNYLIDHGVPEGDIYRDYAGFSTYESMVRAKRVFGVSRAVLVTQGYHLSRALLNARGVGIDAVGVAAPGRREGQLKRDLREVLARVKDPFMVWFKANPTFLGPEVELIPGQGQ